MRVVLDSNVFVSAAIRSGTPPARVLDKWRDQAYELVSSPALLAELQDVLLRPSLQQFVTWTEQEVGELVAAIRLQAHLVEPRQRLFVIKRDPADNRMLEAAIAGQADVIMSGDNDLLDLGQYSGIPILSPSDFLATLDAQ